MNTLIKEIESNINNSVNSFIEKVADKYDLDQSELLELWGSSESDKTKIVTKSIPKAASSVKSDASSTGSCEGCPYIYTKGEKEGQTCNIKPKGGVVYCTRHKKYEGQEPKQKKIMPTIKKSISGNITGVKKASPSKPINTVLRKNKAIDKLWHSSTGMVFKSAKERIVIGKCVNDKLVPLSTEDIEVCMAHSFAYEHEVASENNSIAEDSESDEEVEKKKIVAEESASDEEVEKKKKVGATKVAPVKKSIASSIAATKLQAEDVEAILGELQLKTKKKEVVESEEDLEEDLEEEVEEEDE